MPARTCECCHAAFDLGPAIFHQAADENLTKLVIRTGVNSPIETTNCFGYAAIAGEGAARIAVAEAGRKGIDACDKGNCVAKLAVKIVVKQHTLLCVERSRGIS